MNKEAKKIKLSVFICVTIVLVLIIVGISIYFTTQYQINDKAKTDVESNNKQTISNLDKVENKNTGITQITENSGTAQTTEPQANFDEQKYDIQLAKGSIQLNGEEHSYEIRYSSNMRRVNEAGIFHYSEAILLFDNKVIQTTTLKLTEEKKMNGNVKNAILNKNGEKEQAVIYIDNLNDRAMFYIINNKGEMIQTLDIAYGTSIVINNKTITNRYEIKEKEIIWYDIDSNSTEFAVVKYQMTVGENNRVWLRVLEAYNSSEATLAGKV